MRSRSWSSAAPPRPTAPTKPWRSASLRSALRRCPSSRSSGCRCRSSSSAWPAFLHGASSSSPAIALTPEPVDHRQRDPPGSGGGLEGANLRSFRDLSGQGIVGGDLIRYGPFGQRAGELAARILNGEAASDIPPLEQPSSALIFDCGSSAAGGSPNAAFRPAAWSSTASRRCGASIAGRFGILALTIAQCFSSPRCSPSAGAGARRRRASRWRSCATDVADFTQDCEYWKRPTARSSTISPSCEVLTGYTAAEFVDRPQLLDEMVVEEHRAAWKATSRPRAGGRPPRMECRSATEPARSAGSTLCAPVIDRDGTFLGTRGSDRDITERQRADEELRAAFAEIAPA